MGIDAEILLRVRGAPTAEEIKRWSYDIAAVCGAEKFFIDADKGYTAISRAGTRYRDESDPPPGTVWFQDGPEIVAEPGETFLQVHVWSRYYGPGYERGDLMSLIAIAEWCERNIPNCEVWYGGDSSGVVAEPWPRARRDEFIAHLCGSEGRDYYRDTGTIRPSFEYGMPSQCLGCKLCPPGAVPNRHGWGKDYALYSCPGCGRQFATRDAGETWFDPKKEEQAA